MAKTLRPRMLFLAQTLPYPPDGGVTIRTHHVLRLLSRAFDITALCYFRIADRPTRADVEHSVNALRAFARTEAFAIPQEHSSLRFVADHIRSLIGGKAYTFHAYGSRDFRERLERLLSTEQFDIVHVDSLDLFRYLPLVLHVPVVCVHHNVESELLRRRAAGSRNPAVRWYLRHQAGLVEMEERRWCNVVALNVAVSEMDAQKIEQLAPGARIAVVTNGVDTDRFRPSDGQEQGVVFIGGANWFPNRDALEYFSADILPRIVNRIGMVRVRWVGRATAALARQFGSVPGIELTGYVDDIRPYLRDAACYVVPLRVGGGTRLKILDAWASGKAVVSTSVGCEGLVARDDDNILIRDNPDDFAEAVISVLQETRLRERIGRAARETAERIYSWEVVGQHMIELYLDLVTASPNTAAVGAHYRERATAAESFR